MRKKELENLGGKRLSKRELETLQLIANGLSADEIADRLGVVGSTIKQYRVRLIEKLQARNSVHAVSLAFKKGVLKW